MSATSEDSFLTSVYSDIDRRTFDSDDVLEDPEVSYEDWGVGRVVYGSFGLLYRHFGV